MDVTCKDIMNSIERLAPLSLAEEWDNSGLCIGNQNQKVKKILVALDVIPSVIEEAIVLQADMIVTHHPLLLFQKIKNITNDTVLGSKIIKLIQNDISVYSAHTNLDIAFGGTNDIVAQMAGLEEIEVLEETCTIDGNNFGIGRIGFLSEQVTVEVFAQLLKEKLNLDSIRVVGDIKRKIKKVALCTGSGFEYLMKAIDKKADLYITSDIKFHDAQKAFDENIILIDVTHYASEVIIVPVLKEYIEKEAMIHGYDIEVYSSNVNGQTFTAL